MNFFPVLCPSLHALQQVAEGTFGVVHKAQWLSAVVAVKKLRVHGSSTTTQEVEAIAADFRLTLSRPLFFLPRSHKLTGILCKKFRREVCQLMHLRHPNILSFYGTMTHGNTLAIVTELMDGES